MKCTRIGFYIKRIKKKIISVKKIKKIMRLVPSRALESIKNLNNEQDESFDTNLL